MASVQHAGELGVVAAGHAADPAGGRDVRHDDGVPPAGGLLEGVGLEYTIVAVTCYFS